MVGASADRVMIELAAIELATIELTMMELAMMEWENHDDKRLRTV